MKYISLFAGIGGFDLALNRQGHEAVYVNDWDKYSAQTYEKNFKHKPDTRSIADVETIEIPDHDILVGGFPCQSFSVAGKRGGFSDTRGTLFFEIARILKYKRPAYLLLENVKGLLSHDNGRTFEIIMRTLDELGYDTQWQVLNSKNFGVPQNRERVFIVGHLREASRPEVFPIGESHTVLNKKKHAEQEARSRVSSTIDARYGAIRNSGETYLQYIGGIQGKRDMWIKDDKQNSRNFSQGQRVYSTKGIASALAGNAGGLGGKTGLYAIPVLTPDRQEKRQNGRRFKDDGEPAFTLTSQDRHGVYDGINIRRLTPLECERLQGFPDNWTEGMSDTQRYKQLGNAVTVNVVYEIIKKIT